MSAVLLRDGDGDPLVLRLRPVPHLDYADGFGLGELVLTLVGYALALVVLAIALGVLLALSASFVRGVRTGLRR